MPQNIPDSLKQVLYEEAGYQCAYCGHREGLDLTIHHIVPKEERGPTEYGNLIVLCHNCHHRVHNTSSISLKDLRRIKRHLVHRFFTQPGVNAAKLALKHPARMVVVAPYIIQHLVALGFFEHKEDVETLNWEDASTQQKTAETTLLAAYWLTDEGATVVEQWLLRSDDET